MPLRCRQGWLAMLCSAAWAGAALLVVTCLRAMRQFFGNDYLFSLGSVAATVSSYRGLPVGAGRILIGHGGGMAIA